MKEKCKKIQNIIIGTLICIYFITRFYNLKETYTFSFDQYRDAWVAKEIIIDKKLTLIGPQSSFYGIFYGPGYYYSLAIFYFLSGMSPLGGAYWAIFVGFLTLLILFIVAKELYSLKTAFIASIIYIFSSKINLLLNRDCRNDPPLILISLLILLILYKIKHKYKKNKYLPFILLGLLAGLAYHFHFAGIVFIPLIIITYKILKVRNVVFKSLITLIASIIAIFPIILFDFLHEHMIYKNTLNLLKRVGEGKDGGYIVHLFNNFELLFNNFFTIIVPDDAYLIIKIFFLFLIIFIILKYWTKTRTRKSPVEFRKIFIAWMFFPVLFFSLYPAENYYYYYLLTIPVFIIILSRSIELSLKNKYLTYLTILFFLLTILINGNEVLKYKSPRSLKITEEAINYIKNNSKGKPVFMDYFSKGDFKVGFDYLIYFYKLNVIKQENQNNAKYIFYVPANKINKNYTVKFGDIGIVYSAEKI